jgi:hypothetical protein
VFSLAAVEVPSKRQQAQQAAKADDAKVPRGKNAADVTAAAAAKASSADCVLGSADTPGRHPVYGDPPHPDAEIRMMNGKAFWEFINAKGEEVTVVRAAAPYWRPPVSCP